MSELQAVLDEEIAQLPEKYALPLILCYLEGKTNAQAAAQLGWPEGSISRRLVAGPRLLESRLSRSRPGHSVALIAAVFARPASRRCPAACWPRQRGPQRWRPRESRFGRRYFPRAAKVVQEVVSSMSAAGKFAVPTIAVVASVLLLDDNGDLALGSPVHAASLFHRNRAMCPSMP